MSDWLTENQQALSAELERIAAALEAHADGDQPGAGGERARPPVLEALVAALGLSPFERDVLLLCAGVELEARFASLCASAAGDERIRRASFSLALACLPDAHWSAIAPAAPLRWHRLVELDPGESVTTSPLRIDERVLHHLTGLDYLDDRLQGLLVPVAVPDQLPPSYEAVASDLAAVSRAAPRPSPRWAARMPSRAGRSPPPRAPGSASSFTRCGRATCPPSLPSGTRSAACWQRESALTGYALLARGRRRCRRGRAQAGGGARGRRSAAWLVVSAREPLADLRRPAVRLDVPRLRRSGAACDLGEPPRRVRRRAQRRRGQPRSALRSRAPGDRGRVLAGCRRRRRARTTRSGSPAVRHARPRLDDLAQRIEALAGWEDLVLPEEELAVLREIELHVRGRARVYEEWGFARKSTRGLGVSALFEGASGTGKTMAAEVLARDLDLDLYRIDLSQVVSKYIGETEKNLRRVFDAAEAGGAILLFDEADALFGKRSEVRDSHDRYANIEVSYLLQRMEAYRGLAILTTNQPDALDDAFLRRIRFVVRFPFPDHAQRAEIWRRIFPAETPVSELDGEALGDLSLAGGNIRNVALFAAFLAADEGEPVGMRHIARAAARECAKLERPLTERGVREWL